MDIKTASLIPSQLPAFITEDPEYKNFVLFIQAYYEWMEQNNQVTDRAKNLLNYKDVDETTDEFINYFTNDFLPYFPTETLISKEQAIKVARQMYQTKGTPASYEFLFRILYNSDFDIFYTKDAVLKASAGTWYIAKSLKLSTTNTNFLQTQNLRIFGETTKSIATIENCVFAANKTEVFISNIERLFQSGEFARIVDRNNQDVLFNGEVLRAKIVGQVNQLKIKPATRGLLYQPGDPVVVYGGLSSNTGIGATAIVGETTTGSLQRINVIDGGFGYDYKPNTIIQITNGGGAKANVGSLTPYLPPELSIVDGGHGYRVNDQIQYQNASFAIVTTVDGSGTITGVRYNTIINSLALLGKTANVVSANSGAANAIIKTSTTTRNARANVVLLPTDVTGFRQHTILSNSHYYFANMATANANTTLYEALTFTSIETMPISSVVVDYNGGGIVTTPEISAISTFQTEDSFGEFTINSDLAPLGILAPIQIVNGGHGYRANDKINIVGGAGHGAYANVTTVDSNGAILTVDYVFSTTDNPPKYPKGGLGYTNGYLPAPVVVSSNVQAGGASMYVPAILGTGAKFSVVVDRVGSVTTIKLVDYGEDYIATPNVSLKVQDIVVSNVAISNLPTKGDVLYQGSSVDLASYISTIDSLSLLAPNDDPSLSLYNLRVFNYSSNPNPELPLVIDFKNINYVMANSAFPQFESDYNYVDAVGNVTVYKRNYNDMGIINYGDGNAQANATFLNGLVISQGEYLTSQGQPSSFDVLQNKVYNNYTYQITVEKEIAKYREVLLNLLHPTGMNVIGRYAMKSNNAYDYHGLEGMYQGIPLYALLGEHVDDAITIVGDFNNKSNNIIKFNNLLGANLGNIIFANSSTIQITTDKITDIRSEVLAVNYVSNTITIASNVWTTFGNVATVTGTSGSNTINITSLTGLYDIMNGGRYSNTSYPLMDIVYAGDKVLVANNTSKTVSSVDYINGILYLTSNLTADANSLMAVNRTLIANSALNSDQIRIYGPVGLQYIPELTTEAGETLITEDGQTILLG